MYRNILLVEDDMDDRAIFLQVLEEIDNRINCWWAQNGQDALNTLLAEGNVLPECIFLDGNMPKMSGLECLKVIKADEHLKQIPVIALSTSNSVQAENDMKAAGAVAYITKPNSFEEMVHILSFYLVPENIKKVELNLVETHGNPRWH